MNNNKENIYKLSNAQSGQVLGDFFTIQSAKEVFDNNIIVTGAYVSQDFDPEAMEKAYNLLVKTNDALRIQMLGSVLNRKQRINDYRYEELPRESCGDLGDFQNRLFSFIPPMTIKSEKLCYALIAENKESRSGGLMMFTHHLISDGYSQQLIIDGLEKFYHAYSRGDEPEGVEEHSILTQLKGDEEYFHGDQFKKDREFWKDKYMKQGYYTFPYGRTPFNNRLKAKSFVIQGDDYDRYIEFCKKKRATPASILMTLCALMTRCDTGKDHFFIYNLFHGRYNRELLKTIGSMQGAFPVFFEIPEDAQVGKYVSGRHMEFIKAMYHGRFPMSKSLLMAAPETYIKRFGYNFLWMFLSFYDTNEGEEGRHIKFITPTERFFIGIFYLAVYNNRATRRMELILNYQEKVITDEKADELIAILSRAMKTVMDNEDSSIKEYLKLLK